MPIRRDPIKLSSRHFAEPDFVSRTCASSRQAPNLIGQIRTNLEDDLDAYYAVIEATV